MKKSLIAAALLFTFFSCQNEENVTGSEMETSSIATHRNCATEEMHEFLLKEDPTLAARMAAIEEQTDQFIESGKYVNGVLQIPVVFNVLYRTTAENISQAQLQSQINVLNADFKGVNADYKSNNPFHTKKGSMNVRFYIDRINRKYSPNKVWGKRNLMKYASSGGMNATSPGTKLNFWVCTIGDNLLGYAQFPGGPISTDGVVCDSRYVGTTGTATYPYNKGRTGTHEVGHWMNLRHIWGDRTCGTDYVSDTPVHNAANYGVKATGHRSTCSGQPLEMYMNYMDYSDDRGMYMFSKGQVSRMNAIFASNGSRKSFR